MPEVRVDPLSGHKTIVAGERSRRPGGEPRCPPAQPIPDAVKDPFAEGNEALTPPELYAVRPQGGEPNSPGWKVRVVPNLYPALAAPGSQPSPVPEARPDLFAVQPAEGWHEVIVNGPQSVQSLAELPAEQVELAMETWRQRMQAHGQCAYTQLIVNERREGGGLAGAHARAVCTRLTSCPRRWRASVSAQARTQHARWATIWWRIWWRRRCAAG